MSELGEKEAPSDASSEASVAAERGSLAFATTPSLVAETFAPALSRMSIEPTC